MMRRTWLTLPVLLLLLVASLASGVSAGSPASQRPRTAVAFDPALPVHPYLQYGAQVEPDRMVRIIVRKAGLRSRSDEIAKAAGARVLEEFRVTPSLVLEVPQKMVLKLAKNSNVKYISYDGPVNKTALDISKLKTTYPKTVQVTGLWSSSEEILGIDVPVAVLDTGLNGAHPGTGLGKCFIVNQATTTCEDPHGHGTHVVGIIKGQDAEGRYIGIAPKASIYSLKVADNNGRATEADLLRGLDWVYQHRSEIRVVNLSLSAAAPSSYSTSPLAEAVEKLWVSGVVVVAAASNRGSAADSTWFPPGNDPFIITVGALDESDTADPSDDTLASFSARGLTQDLHYKPDLVAPGRRIVAPLASTSSTVGQLFPDRIVDENYIRLSGTSMAAPVVTGAVALLLQKYPGLTPNQVKWLLTNTASQYPGQPDSAGLMNIQGAFDRAAAGSVGEANQGVTPHPGISLSTGVVSTSEAYWDQAYWDQYYWDQMYWDLAEGMD